MSSKQAFYAWFNAKVDRLTDGSKAVVKNAGQEGKDLIVHFIETRGTAKSGKAGRIETGAMRDSVDTRVEKESATEIQVSFGYYDTPFIQFGKKGGPGILRPCRQWVMLGIPFE